MPVNKRKVFSRNQQGAILVEAVIVIPILLLIIFLTFDFCFIYARKFRFDDAVRSTGRKLQSNTGNCKKFVNITLGSELEKAGAFDYFLSHSGSFDSTTYPNGETPYILSVQGGIPCFMCRFGTLTSDGDIAVNSSVLVTFEPGSGCNTWSKAKKICKENETTGQCKL